MEDFFHFGGNIINLTGLKKQMVAVEITRRWGKDIIEEGEIVIAYMRDGMSMEQGWWYIFLSCIF